MATGVEALIREGVAALKAGRKDEAFELLTRATELDERNEDAWLWLSAVVDNLENQQICLENVLAINPHNTRALHGLNQIQKKLESRAHPNLDADPFDMPQAPSAPPAPSTSPFDLNAPAPGAAPGGYHGSGRAVDLPSGPEYDAWVDNLNLGASEDAAGDDFVQGDDFADDGYGEAGGQDFFDPFAMPAAGALDYADDDYDALAELEAPDEDDETLFDDMAFDGVSPFGIFEEDPQAEYQSETSLVGYLTHLPPDIKPTHLPGQQPLYPRSLIAGIGVVSVGIIAALIVLALLLV